MNGVAQNRFAGCCANVESAFTRHLLALLKHANGIFNLTQRAVRLCQLTKPSVWGWFACWAAVDCRLVVIERLAVLAHFKKHVAHRVLRLGPQHRAATCLLKVLICSLSVLTCVGTSLPGLRQTLFREVVEEAPSARLTLVWVMYEQAVGAMRIRHREHAPFSRVQQRARVTFRTRHGACARENPGSQRRTE